MDNPSASSKRKRYTPLRIQEKFTPEREHALEEVVTKFLQFMDANALRQRAIQNIQAKIATIENDEQNNKKKRVRKKRVVSFQNSSGCLVRMSDDFSTISEKPIPIINVKRRRKKNVKKPLPQTPTKAAVITVLNSPRSSLKKSVSFSTFSEKPSPTKNCDKKKKVMESVCLTPIKTPVISFPKSLECLVRRNSNFSPLPGKPSNVENPGTKKEVLEPIRPTRIKTSVTKFVPEDSRMIANKMERRRIYYEKLRKLKKSGHQ